VANSVETPDRILQRLDLKVIRKLDGLLQGDYRTLFYGQGSDFTDLREYQPEDDVRHIDWNVTARLDEPYVRKYVEDREITAWFLLDMSPSIDFGPDGKGKRDALVSFVATLARVLTRRGNRVGAMLYAAKLERTIPARSGRQHVLRMINDLIAYPRLDKAPQTDLKPLIDGALQGIKRRSLIVLVSDFISDPGWERPLGMLSRRHDVLTVRLNDPRESALPDVGLIVMEDAETGEQIYVDTHDPSFRNRFQEVARERESALSSAFKSAGVDAMDLSTEEDLVRAIMRFAEKRKTRRK
jgi:uncharacterized protein (DUF58 family)